MDTQPTPEELADIRLCAQKLWDLDDNKLEPEKHYGIDIQVQNHNSTYSSKKESICSMGSVVSKKEMLLKANYSVESLVPSGNNLLTGPSLIYSTITNGKSLTHISCLSRSSCSATGVEETLTQQERQENIAFITAIMHTRPMKYIHNYLIAKVHDTDV